MSDLAINSPGQMMHRGMKTVLDAPGHVLRFNPGQVLEDVAGTFVHRKTPALQSQAEGLNKTVNHGTNFVGNTPNEIRSAAK